MLGWSLRDSFRSTAEERKTYLSAPLIFGVMKKKKHQQHSRPIESKIVGDHVHERFDSSNHDNKKYGPCLCCGAADLAGHKTAVFNCFAASELGAEERVWHHLECGEFEAAKKVRTHGTTDIRDHYFELVLCSGAGCYMVHSLFDRGNDKPAVLRRAIVNSGITVLVDRWNDLGSYTIISPKEHPCHPNPDQ
jgi:hypothetical protein